MGMESFRLSTNLGAFVALLLLLVGCQPAGSPSAVVFSPDPGEYVCKILPSPLLSSILPKGRYVIEDRIRLPIDDRTPRNQCTISVESQVDSLEVEFYLFIGPTRNLVPEAGAWFSDARTPFPKDQGDGMAGRGPYSESGVAWLAREDIVVLVIIGSDPSRDGMLDAIRLVCAAWAKIEGPDSEWEYCGWIP